MRSESDRKAETHMGNERKSGENIGEMQQPTMINTWVGQMDPSTVLSPNNQNQPSTQTNWRSI